jgi:uncharacterized protein YhbP (UPF0306 family)
MLIKFENAKYSSKKLAGSIERIIRATALCSMATVSIDAKAHINTAYYCVSDSFDLFFVSDPKTTHSKNVQHSPTMSVAIFHSSQKWGSSLRGLQLFGQCFRSNDTEAAEGERLYGSRFPAYRSYRKSLSPKELKESPHRFFIFRPSTVKVFDEDVFGEENFVLATIVRRANG